MSDGSAELIFRDPETFEEWRPKDLAELLEGLDSTRDKAAEAIESASDEHLTKIWTMKVNGQEMMAMPRVAVLRSFVLNHHYHHRGQLEVYLRLKDVPLPAIYGPTAAEPYTGSSS